MTNPVPNAPHLTDNEREVLTRSAHGDTYGQISRALGITEKSVGNIAVRVIHKLNAENITNAVLIACHAGILDGRPRRHGDHAGFAAHKYRGEDPCEACWAGERAYRNAQKKARRKTPRTHAA